MAKDGDQGKQEVGYYRLEGRWMSYWCVKPFCFLKIFGGISSCCKMEDVSMCVCVHKVPHKWINL